MTLFGTVRDTGDSPGESEGEEEEESQSMEAFDAHSFLAGGPPFPEQPPRLPLPNYHPDLPADSDLTALPLGPEQLFHSQAATVRRLLSPVLSVPPSGVFVLRRIVEMPNGVDREVLLADLRWTDAHDFDDVASLVSSGPLSPRRIWVGFVLTGDDVLVLPIPLPCHVLEEAVEELGFSSSGPLRPGLRSGPPAYGLSFLGADGRVWAIHEGDGLPDQALMLLPDGGHIAEVKLKLPVALPRPPPAGLWEVPPHHHLVVRGNLART